MAITLTASAPNNADWKIQFQFTDGVTGDLIDFTGATIDVEVKDMEGCRRISASTNDGKITIISTGLFELLIPVSEMSQLRPGNYAMGGVYQIDGETISLFTGTLSIIDGIARL